jgi:guanylate kinase
MNNKRIILVGRSASGKDLLRKRFESKGFSYSVSYTTRPPREGEINGKDYIFITDREASEMIGSNQFYEWSEFNGWIYGITRQQFSSDQVFIMPPAQIKRLSKEDRSNSFIIFLNIDDQTLASRLIARNMPGDSADRRLAADREDFRDFSDFDLQITDPNF